MNVSQSPQSIPRVLLIVSDADIRRGWTSAVHAQGYIVSSTGDSVGAEMLLQSFRPDIVVLDIDLPWRQYVGDPISAILRRTHAWLIVATSARLEIECERLPRAGAHEVIAMNTTPLDLIEKLRPFIGISRDLADVETMSPEQPADTVPETGHARFGSLTLDMDERIASVDGRPVPLTRIEFDLLAELCRRPHGVSLRSDLLVSVWGEASEADTHLVDVHLSNMRRKLSAAKPGIRFVQTVRGMGFRLSDALMQGSRAEAMHHNASTVKPQAYIASSHHWPASTAAR